MPVTAEQPSVVVRTDNGEIGRAFTWVPATGGMAVNPSPIYPCRTCGWAMSCEVTADEDGCHT